MLAAILAGLILAGILAATMSTADSQMLAAASSVSQNILQEFGHMKLTEKQSLFAARLTIICVSVVGVVLARDPNSSVFGHRQALHGPVSAAHSVRSCSVRSSGSAATGRARWPECSPAA